MDERDRAFARQQIEEAVALGYFTLDEIRDMPIIEILLAYVMKQTEREAAAERAALKQAETVRCPFCGAEPARSCVKVRGRYAGRPVRWPSFHAPRMAAAVEAAVRSMLSDTQ